MLTTLRRDGSPVTVPVWYEWDGQRILMFCGADSAKLKRIEHDPRVTVVVANDVDEVEYWVSFDGDAEVEPGGFDLAERLAGRYWDLEDRGRASTLELWRSAKDDGFRQITLTPSRVRTYNR